jgi:mannose-6-phosphate isomerase-like protein (cupin superfamily)
MEIHDPVSRARAIDSFGFAQLGQLNGVPLGVVRASGFHERSAWERHRDTDELLMVLGGSVTVEILTDHDSHLVPLTAGQFTIVPRGHWHRHTMARDLIELFYMPGSNEQSTADDPRVEPNRLKTRQRRDGAQRPRAA